MRAGRLLAVRTKSNISCISGLILGFSAQSTLMGRVPCCVNAGPVEMPVASLAIDCFAVFRDLIPSHHVFSCTSSRFLSTLLLHSTTAATASIGMNFNFP